MRYGLLLVMWGVTIQVAALDVIAHRGFACGHADNSLGAISYAWESGADGVEVDVRVSIDKVAYLFHDDTLESEPVDAMTYETVQALTDYHVPTLFEALQNNTRAGYVVLDLKSVDTSALRHIAEAVRLAAFPLEKLVVQSDSALGLRDARRRLPGARFMYLSRLKYTIPFILAPGARGIVKQARFARADGVSLKGRRFINKPYLDTFSQADLAIYLWTINSPESQAYYRQFAPAALITDRVEHLRGLLDGNPSESVECKVEPALKLSSQ